MNVDTIIVYVYTIDTYFASTDYHSQTNNNALFPTTTLPRFIPRKPPSFLRLPNHQHLLHHVGNTSRRRRSRWQQQRRHSGQSVATEFRYPRNDVSDGFCVRATDICDGSLCFVNNPHHPSLIHGARMPVITAWAKSPSSCTGSMRPTRAAISPSWRVAATTTTPSSIASSATS